MLRGRLSQAACTGSLNNIMGYIRKELAEDESALLDAETIEKYGKYVLSDSLIARFLFSLEAFSTEQGKGEATMRQIQLDAQVANREKAAAASPPPPPPRPPLPIGHNNDLYITWLAVAGDRRPTLSIKSEFSMLDVVDDFLTPPPSS